MRNARLRHVKMVVSVFLMAQVILAVAWVFLQEKVKLFLIIFLIRLKKFELIFIFRL
jgi:hypothetical protein